MNEHGELATIPHEPQQSVADHRVGNGQLATATRMRTHRGGMHPSHGDAKDLAHGFAKQPRLLGLISIEIDVSVPVYLGHAMF
jgi:hypothetical protein